MNKNIMILPITVTSLQITSTADWGLGKRWFNTERIYKDNINLCL